MRSVYHPLSIDVKILDLGWVIPVGGQNLNFSDRFQMLPVRSVDHPLSIDVKILDFG